MAAAAANAAAAAHASGQHHGLLRSGSLPAQPKLQDSSTSGGGRGSTRSGRCRKQASAAMTSAQCSATPQPSTAQHLRTHEWLVGDSGTSTSASSRVCRNASMQCRSSSRSSSSGGGGSSGGSRSSGNDSAGGSSTSSGGGGSNRSRSRRKKRGKHRARESGPEVLTQLAEAWVHLIVERLDAIFSHSRSHGANAHPPPPLTHRDVQISRDCVGVAAPPVAVATAAAGAGKVCTGLATEGESFALSFPGRSSAATLGKRTITVVPPTAAVTTAVAATTAAAADAATVTAGAGSHVDDFAAASELLDRTAAEAMLSRTELTRVIQQLGQRGSVRAALAVFRWMEAQQASSPGGHVGDNPRPRLRPNSHAYNLMLGILCRAPSSSRSNSSGGGGVDGTSSGSGHHVKVNGSNGRLLGGGAGRGSAGGRHGSGSHRGGGRNGTVGFGGRGSAGSDMRPAAMLAEARRIFASMRSLSGIRDRVHAFNAMLSGLIRHGKYMEAWALFEEMLTASPGAMLSSGDRLRGEGVGKAGAGCRPSAQSGPDSAAGAADSARCGDGLSTTALPSAPGHFKASAAVSRGTDHRGTSSRGHDVYQAPAPPPDTITFNTMLTDGACLTSRRTTHAPSPNSASASPASTSAAGKQGTSATAADCALWLYRELLKRELQPTVRTFNALIAALVRAGRCEQAESLVVEMQRAGVPPDMVTYNLLITAYGRADRLSDAERALSAAVAAGLRPTTVTFSALMGAYAAAGMMSEAVETFRAMEGSGLRLDTKAFCGLMAVYKDAGMADEAERTFRRMVASGVRPNAVAYGCLIHAYGREGRVEDAARVFEEMLAAAAGGVEGADSTCAPDVQSFNILMAAYGQQGLSVPAARVYRRMLAHGLVPDTVTFNTLLHAFCVAGLPAQAARTWGLMSAAGCEPDAVTHGLLYRVFNDAGWHSKVDELKAAAAAAVAAEAAAEEQGAVAAADVVLEQG